MECADRQKMRFFQKFCFIRKVSTKSCRMSPVGVSYDQNSRFSLFPDFCGNQICYKECYISFTHPTLPHISDFQPKIKWLKMSHF